MSKKYIKSAIQLVISNYKEISFDIYIKISDEKIIKIAHGNEECLETLKKYQNKGLEHVYVEKKDFENFLGLLRKRVNSKFFKSESPEENALSFAQIFDMAKEAMLHIGASKIQVDAVAEIGISTLKSLKKMNRPFVFFQKFKNQCSEEALRVMLIGHLGGIILNEFNWATENIKEKFFLAAFLSDVLLTKEELETMNNNSFTEGDNVFNHPKETAKYFQTHCPSIGSEVFIIIEQHHELPSGDGYPQKLTTHNFSPLSALFVICQYFVNRLKKADFDYKERFEILDEIVTSFHTGPFRKPSQVLAKLLNNSSAFE